MSRYLRGLNVLGGVGTAIGAFDLGVIQHALDRMKKMSVAQAGVLVKYGQKVIDAAIKDAGSLPGGGKRDEVKGKLAWHANAVSKLFDPAAPYGAADDLKLWTKQAFVEWNATEEGKKYAQANWDAMLDEVENRAVKVLEKPGQIVEKIASIPWWGWAIGIGGVTLLASSIAIPLFVRRR